MQYELYSYPIIDSTNDEAKRLIQSGSKGNLIITSDQQTKGRGRENRSWVSDKGNLCVSIVLDLTTAQYIRITDFCFVAGLAVYKSIENLAKYKTNQVKLKWPNDLIINDKKVAGILIESINFAQKNYLIIGIGVNVISNPIDLIHTTNLVQEGIKITSNKLLKILIKQFENHYLIWQNQGFEIIQKLWIEKAYRLNQEVTFKQQEKALTGIFRSIAENGDIILQTSAGNLEYFSLGEIFM